MRYRNSIAAAVLGIAIAAPAHAENQDEVDVAAGRLGSAIFVVGEQAGISIGLADPQLGARRWPKIKGPMSCREALLRRHAGSSAKTERVHAGHWRIVPIRKKSRPAPTRVGYAATRTFAPPISYPDIVV